MLQPARSRRATASSASTAASGSRRTATRATSCSMPAKLSRSIAPARRSSTRSSRRARRRCEQSCRRVRCGRSDTEPARRSLRELACRTAERRVMYPLDCALPHAARSIAGRCATAAASRCGRCCRKTPSSEQDLVRRLSMQARYNRFFVPIRELSKSVLEQLTHVDHQHHVALVAETFVDGVAHAVGEAQYVVDETHGDCEFAVVVTDDCQRQASRPALVADADRACARCRLANADGRCARHQRRRCSR